MKRAASQIVTLGLLQTACAANPEANLKHTLALAARAARAGARIICTQELFRSRYFCQSEDHRNFSLAEKIPGPSTDGLSPSSPASTGWSSSPRCSRSARQEFITIPPPSLTPTVRCWAPTARCTFPTTRCTTRNFILRRATLVSRPGRRATAKIGVLICWDQWYPEAARLTAMQGAEILFYPTAIGWHPGEKKKYGLKQHGAWETIQRAHAVANGCYVAAANRIGHEILDGVGGEGIEFWGQSFVAGTSGRNHRQGRLGRGGNPDRARGPGQRGHHPHALAIPARPAD